MHNKQITQLTVSTKTRQVFSHNTLEDITQHNYLEAAIAMSR